MGHEQSRKRDRSVVKQVCNEYGFEPTETHFVKGVWQVSDGEQIYACKSSTQSPEKLILIHDLLENVVKEGYEHALPWIKTKLDQPFVSIEERQWYLTPWKQPSKEIEVEYHPEALIRSLAIFHRMAEPLVHHHAELMNQVGKEVVEDWKLKLARLTDYQQVVQTREYKSPFDKVYLGQLDQVEKLFTFAIKGMERFVESDLGTPPRYTLCHRRLHPSNIVRDNEQFYWIDFDHAEIDSPVRDLALYLRRFHTPDGDVASIQQLIEVYESESPLSAKEKKLLAIYLSYPEQLLRLTHKYYEGPRVYSESDAVIELEQEMHHSHVLYDAVRHLWVKKPESEEKSALKSTTKPSVKQASKPASGPRQQKKKLRKRQT